MPSVMVVDTQKQEKLLDRNINMRDKSGRFIKGHTVDSHTREAVRQKNISRWLSGERLGFQTGNNNPSWKDRGYGKSTVHEWIIRRKPKSKICENCGEDKKLELSNCDHKYSRNIKDYNWLCRSCHRFYEYKTGLR